MVESRTIPGPAPIKGLFALLNLTSSFRNDALGTVQEFVDTYGDFVGIEIMGQKQFITTNAEVIRETLVTQADKFIKDVGYTDKKKGLARFFGNGLLTSDGEFWKRQRKLVAPALHTKRIEAYAEAMVDFTTARINGWRDNVRLDISREMNAITMQIVAKTLFNTTMNGDLSRFGEAMGAVQELMTTGQFSLLPTWVPTPLELRGRKAKRILDEFVDRVINEWRVTGEDKGDLLSMLLMAEDEDGNHMTDQQARDEVLTLFLAGHETTANTLNWTWMLLAQNPEIEAKLHAELDTVLQGRTPTLMDLRQLPYTEMVIKESMRLYPPAWSFSRENTEDLIVHGYPIPKGSNVVISAYGTHRNPAYWEQPDTFIPERFSKEREDSIHKYSYIPFGGGPRVCIGFSFAMMETQLLLATMAQRYRLRLEPGQMVEKAAMITLFPKNGLPMTIQQREPVKQAVTPEKMLV
ncbi:MAG: cytochrome P450 [Anaerolineae bacterium]|nr:cytochrome P450 [Anaerolineae bacterium]